MVWEGSASLDWLLSGTIVVVGAGTMVSSAYTLASVAVYAVSGSMSASTKNPAMFSFLDQSIAMMKFPSPILRYLWRNKTVSKILVN